MARIFLSEGETYGTIGPFSATDVIGTNVLLGAQVITASPETLDDLESMPALSASFEGPPADTTPPVDSNVLNLG